MFNQIGMGIGWKNKSARRVLEIAISTVDATMRRRREEGERIGTEWTRED